MGFTVSEGRTIYYEPQDALKDFFFGCLMVAREAENSISQTASQTGCRRCCQAVEALKLVTSSTDIHSI